MTINKAGLIAEVAARTGATSANAKIAVEAVFESVSDALKEGHAVDVFGFGSFKPVEKPARTGRNPSTGQPVQIAAKVAVKFTPAKALKDAANNA